MTFRAFLRMYWGSGFSSATGAKAESPDAALSVATTADGGAIGLLGSYSGVELSMGGSLNAFEMYCCAAG